MAKRKKKDEIGFVKPTTGLVKGSVILGVGGSVVSGVGGSTAGTAGGGLVTAASFMPAMGTATGAGLTVQQLRKLEKQTKRRR